MRRPLASAFVLAALMTDAGAGARAQVPDFSGTWRWDPAQTVLTGGPERVDGRGRSGGRITGPVKVRHVPPEYPESALRSRTEGTVMLEAVIDKRGVVVDARVIVSSPPFDRAAQEAVAQWRFQPATMDGEPVPIIMTATVNFSLFGRGRPVPPVRPPSGGRGSGTGPGTGPGVAQPAEITISQTADALVVTRDTGVGTERLTYRLDGKAAKNRQLGRGGGAPGEYIFETRWDNAKLISTITGPDGKAATRTETRYLDGETMIVETVRPAPEGAPDWHVREVCIRVR